MTLDCECRQATLFVEVIGMTQSDGLNFQAQKALVRAFHEALDNSRPDTVVEDLARFVAPEWQWRGMHPFHEQRGPQAVADAFWTPLRRALKPLQRRPDIFIAGLNEIDGYKGIWVVEMGHLMGLFDEPWLGIRPT